MNKEELRVELIRHNLTPPKAAQAIGVGKKAFYAKMYGEAQFKQNEIAKLKEMLELSPERLCEIFFNNNGQTE